MQNEKENEMSVRDAVEEMKQEGKKVLTLIIKLKYLEEIIAGTRKVERREVKESNCTRLIQFDKSGKRFLIDEEEHAIPVHYDALLLYAGFHKEHSALVEVVDAKEEFFYDENGEVICYEDVDGTTYPSHIVYSLGRVIAKDVRPKQRDTAPMNATGAEE